MSHAAVAESCVRCEQYDVLAQPPHYMKTKVHRPKLPESKLSFRALASTCCCKPRQTPHTARLPGVRCGVLNHVASRRQRRLLADHAASGLLQPFNPCINGCFNNIWIHDEGIRSDAPRACVLGKKANRQPIASDLTD